MSLREYVHKIKPLSAEKARQNIMQYDYCNEKEHRLLRALVGVTSWPVTQCLPQDAATISILQANIVVKDYVFTIRCHGELRDLRMGVYCYAAWSPRPDGSLQGLSEHLRR